MMLVLSLIFSSYESKCVCVAEPLEKKPWEVEYLMLSGFVFAPSQNPLSASSCVQPRF